MATDCTVVVGKSKTTAAVDQAVQRRISGEMLAQPATGLMTSGQIQELFEQFKKAVLARALNADINHPLGYAPEQAKPDGADSAVGASNHRNGKSAKTVLTDAGALRTGIQRDRGGSFEPQRIGAHERRFTGLGHEIVGMTVCEIQGFWTEMSPSFFCLHPDSD